MLRREIFNIFLGAVQSKPISDQKAAVIEMPPHLNTEHTAVYEQEFHQLPAGTPTPFEVSTHHAFSITWAPNRDDVAEAFDLQLKKEGEDQGAAIRFGIHPDGYLYIGDVADTRKIAQLTEGLVIKLDVVPQASGVSHAKLLLTDQSGLTLAVLKTTQYPAHCWQGQLINPAHGLRHLKIEGRI